MVQGGGCRPSAAPWTPARAPRATRAYTRRAFPPETSGPATRPRRGLAPRRPGGWELYQLIARHTLAPSNRPSLLARSMRVQNYLGALAPCAVRERQVARPVARRRAARPTGPPMARICGARRHLPSCGSVRKSPRASPHPRLGPPAGQLRAAAKPAALRALATTVTSPLCQSDLLGIADGSARKTSVANSQDRALPGAPCEIAPKSRTVRPEAGDVEGPGTFQTAARVDRVCGLDWSQLHPSAHEHSPVHVRVPVHALPK
jgi:hypothetical protein